LVLKNVRDKVEKGWTWTKKILAAMSVWGLIFSLVTIGKLGVAFDYDDTLVFSAPAFAKASAQAAQRYSAGFWSVVNQSYDLERPKLLAYGLAWVFRVFGFRVSVLTSRPPVDAEALKKEWRHLVPRGRFIFAGEGTKAGYLQDGNCVLFFGDGDSDIAEAKRAKVLAVRIRRGARSFFAREDYNPGSLGEYVLPLSEY